MTLIPFAFVSRSTIVGGYLLLVGGASDIEGVYLDGRLVPHPPFTPTPADTVEPGRETTVVVALPSDLGLGLHRLTVEWGSDQGRAWFWVWPGPVRSLSANRYRCYSDSPGDADGYSDFPGHVDGIWFSCTWGRRESRRSAVVAVALYDKYGGRVVSAEGWKSWWSTGSFWFQPVYSDGSVGNYRRAIDHGIGGVTAEHVPGTRGEALWLLPAPKPSPGMTLDGVP